MNIINKNVEKEKTQSHDTDEISELDAEQAVETLLKWIGDDPKREGLIETPKRVLKAYKEWFAGYQMDPKSILSKTFSEVNSYDQQVVLKDISFDSYCEHHFAPITGKVHIGYLPKNKVVGLSKLARLVDVFAKRLQVQEKMTSQIASTLQTHLNCRGVGVVVEAEHHCMCTRGVNKKGTTMRTSFFTGEFSKDLVKRNDFLNSII